MMKAGNDTVNSSVPVFLLKLVNMLQAEKFHDLVSWNESGTSFIIKDQENFSKVVLPQYFKHNKFPSFVRQLNLYGFRKVNSISHGLLNQPEFEEFRHPFFIKGKPGILHLIRRKATRSTNKTAEEIAQVLDEVHVIKDTQSEITDALSEIKQENEDLWREVVLLRQKHAQQQKVVNHLIKFLVSLVQHHGMGRKRRLPLEWKNQEDSSTSTNKWAKQDYNDQIIGANKTSPSGPLITELLSTSSPISSLTTDESAITASDAQKDDGVFDIADLIDSDNHETNSALEANQMLQTQNLAAQPDQQRLSITSPNAQVEPNIFLNLNQNQLRPAITLPSSSSSDSTAVQAALRSRAADKDAPVSTDVSVDVPATVFKPKPYGTLNSNMEKVQSNLQNIQQRLVNNDEYQLDLDTLQDLFNGEAVLPQSSNDWSNQLPLTIPLIQTEKNQLVQYTGDTPVNAVSEESEDETNFEDLSALLD